MQKSECRGGGGIHSSGGIILRNNMPAGGDLLQGGYIFPLRQAILNRGHSYKTSLRDV